MADPWSEFSWPDARAYRTRTKVYVGGALEFVEQVAFNFGEPLPLAASTTLAQPFGHVAPGDVWISPLAIYLTNASAFLTKGAVQINDELWVTYSGITVVSVGLHRLDHVAFVTPGRNDFPVGTRVDQWREITSMVSKIRLNGDVRGSVAGWEAEIEGANWNSQIIYEHASLLIMQQQWDEVTQADTSWRTRFVGFLDVPEPSLGPEGKTIWRVRAHQWSHYLKLTTLPAKTYGLVPIPGQRTASSSLQDPGQLPLEGGYLAGDMGPNNTGDGKIQTFWASNGQPVRTTMTPASRMLTPTALEVDERKSWAYAPHIQQVFCSAADGGMYTRQEQTWIEIYNPTGPEDYEDERGNPITSMTHAYVNSLIIENSRGQRMYLGWKNGSQINETRIVPWRSMILCYDADIFRRQHEPPDDTLIFPYRECDGWWPGLKRPWRGPSPGYPGDPEIDPHTGVHVNNQNGYITAENNVAYRNVGAAFWLDPDGDWVAIRRARAFNPAPDSWIDVDSESGPLLTTGQRAGVHGERWLDFVAWGDVRLPGDPLSKHPNGFWSREPSLSEDVYSNQNNASSRPSKVWVTAPFQGSRPPRNGQRGIGVGKSIRRELQSPYAIAAEPDVPPAMGGGVYDAWEDDPFASRLAGYNEDSQSAADWVERVPIIGNENTLIAGEWIKITCDEFPAPVCIFDNTVMVSTEPGYGTGPITVDDDRFLPTPPAGYSAEMTVTNRSGADGWPMVVRYSAKQDGVLTITYKSHPAESLAGDGGAIPPAEFKIKVPARTGVALSDQGQVWRYANLYQVAAIVWRRRQHTDGSAPSVPTRYDIRITGQQAPGDPVAWIGESFDWDQPVHVTENSRQFGVHPILSTHGYPVYAQHIFFEIYAMSDGGRAILNELQAYAVGSDLAIDPATGMPSRLFSSADVADMILARAGVPARQRHCLAGSDLLSFQVAQGSAYAMLESLAEKSSCVLSEDRAGHFWWGWDPRITEIGKGRVPRFTLNLAVARREYKQVRKPRFGASQVELLARNDVTQDEWTVVMPPVPLRLGEPPRRIGQRFAQSPRAAIRAAEIALRQANSGLTVDVNLGSFDDFNLLDVVRVEGITGLDASHHEEHGRDFFVTSASFEITHQGMEGSMRLMQRQL